MENDDKPTAICMCAKIKNKQQRLKQDKYFTQITRQLLEQKHQPKNERIGTGAFARRQNLDDVWRRWKSNRLQAH